MAAIVNDADTAIESLRHHCRRGVAGFVETALRSLKHFITRGIGVLGQDIVDIADMVVVVLVVIARALVGRDAQKDREVGTLLRVALVLEELFHLHRHLVNALSGDFADDDIGILVIAHQLTIVVVADVAARRDSRELLIVAHQDHIDQVMAVVVVEDIVLDGGGGVANRGEGHNLGCVAVAPFPVSIGLHRLTEIIGGQNEHIAILLQWRGLDRGIVQEVVGIDIIEAFGHLGGMAQCLAGVVMHPDGDAAEHLQLLAHRVVGKRVEVERHTAVVAQTVGLAHRHNVVLLKTVFKIGGALYVRDLRRVDSTVELALGGGQLKTGHGRKVGSHHLGGGRAVVGHYQGEGGLQQLGRANLQHRVGLRHHEFAHLHAVDLHGNCLVGREIHPH